MPLLFQQENPRLGVWKLEESSEELLRFLSLHSFYEPFLNKISIEKRRCEWLACRVLLKELLKEEVAVSYYPNGAPYIDGFPGTISFSHTKGYVAVLVSEKEVAGIDIEQSGSRAFKLRDKFMNESERLSADESWQTEHALVYWSAKETLFKMIGQEGVDFRKHLHVSSFPYATCGSFDVKETRTPQQCSYRLTYYLTPEFALTWSE